MLETLEEPSEKRIQTIPTLTYVLSYDRLLDLDSTQFNLVKALPLTIGRADDDQPISLQPGSLRIPDPFLSGKHATFERRGSGIVLRDNASRNGTRVNGAGITECSLADGDLIEVGHALLCFRLVNATALAVIDALPCLGPVATLCPEVAVLGQALKRIAPSREPVLILAETGSGKEVAAAALHELSRREGAFRAVDCGAVPENLFESTLFGHRKGAFTGAESDRVGEIVAADGGTLFLDEVGNMSPSAQAKLLRVIETGEVTPVGAAQSQKVDVRWVAATNRDLFKSGDDFREDLLRRLAGYIARLPPLRKRREDLGVLSSYLLRDASVAAASMTPTAARLLFGAELPGNIRQLRASLRSAALLADGEAIDIEHLPDFYSESQPSPDSKLSKSPGKSAAPSAEALAKVLRETEGNVVQAAANLGTHARQIYRWIERHGLDLDDYRVP